MWCPQKETETPPLDALKGRRQVVLDAETRFDRMMEQGAFAKYAFPGCSRCRGHPFRFRLAGAQDVRDCTGLALRDANGAGGPIDVWRFQPLVGDNDRDAPRLHGFKNAHGGWPYAPGTEHEPAFLELVDVVIAKVFDGMARLTAQMGLGDTACLQKIGSVIGKASDPLTNRMRVS